MSGVPVFSTSPPPVWPMYRALVGIGLLCGLLIVSVYQLTRPAIERNRAEALQRAIFEVLPGARSSATFLLVDGRFEILSGEARGAERVHAGYDADGKFLGLALEAQAMGYQDVIRLLYGYAPAEQAVIGIEVLESRETPGLGDRISTDATFLENFVRLDVAVSDDGGAIRHPIEAVKQGAKEHAWQVDGITGATISSAAVAEALRESTGRWIPAVRGNLGSFQVAE